ncbi:MAG: nucleoside recognition domain-containing protein, partial [Enterococcus sp.]|nr:nucleoside recognition domain-containing protein [Enterococcus sp.]
GLVAKENVIGTFGILYRHAEVAEDGVEIWKSLQAAYTPVAGYSFLVFNLLCAPCFAAMGAIHREMGDIKWTWRAIGYQCGLAYVVSFIIYQIGHVVFEGGALGVGFILAIGLIVAMLYFILRKPVKQSPTITIEEIKEVKEWQL